MFLGDNDDSSDEEFEDVRKLNIKIIIIKSNDTTTPEIPGGVKEEVNVTGSLDNETWRGFMKRADSITIWIRINVGNYVEIGRHNRAHKVEFCIDTH